jgi:hypothetical protein
VNGRCSPPSAKAAPAGQSSIIRERAHSSCSNLGAGTNIPQPNENDQPITLGADPDGSSHFEVDIQLFDVTSF